MAKKKTPPQAQLDAFLASCTPKQRGVCDRLKECLAEPDPNLAWHHRVGALVVELHQGEGRFPYRGGWARTLAGALGCSLTFLYKARAFARHYSAQDAGRLEGQLSWDKVSLLLSIKDAKVRQRLQREAIQGRWAYTELRLEIQKRMGLRRTRGSRPLPEPENYGHGAALQQLVRQAKLWMKFHDNVWMGGKGPTIDALEKLSLAECDVLPLRHLQDQLTEAERLVTEVQRAAAALSRHLPALLKKVEEELRRR